MFAVLVILFFQIILNISLLWISTLEDTQVIMNKMTSALSFNSLKSLGMVAFELSSTMAAQKFISLLKVVKGAASLGSSHSLVCQPAKLTHVMCTQEVITLPLTEQNFLLYL